MRHLVKCFLLFLSIDVQAQINFAGEVQSLINSANNHFTNYKGKFLNCQEKDSVFSSLKIITGTKKDVILYSNEMTIYSATIVDSVKLRKGKKLVDEWADGLRRILSNDFKQEAVNVVDWNPSRYGWKFIKGNIWISVDVYPYAPNPDIFLVLFGITQIKQL